MKIQHALIYIATSLGTLLISCAPEETEEPIPDLSGNYSCSETTSNPAGTTTFSVNIKKTGSGNENYRIENFYNLGFNHSALFSVSGGSITLSNQNVSNFSASGSGTVISATRINLSYQMSDGSGPSGIDNCTATLTKQ
jgi:hypothetical protein